VRQWAAAGVPVCTAPKDQIGPRIALDGEKGAIVTWEDDRSGDPDIYARRVDGTGTPVWAADGLLVYGDANRQSKPRIATDDFGTAIVAWQDDRAGQLDIYAQEISRLGSVLWPAAGVVVCAQPGAQQDPAIAADGSGGALISWRDARSGVDDIYVQRIDPSGAPHCDPSGVALCLATNQQYDNVLAPDGVGGGVVAWTDGRGTHYGDTKVYAMRIPPECGSLTTGVEGEEAPEAGNRLLQNQPNPFNPATTIAYETAKSGRVRVAVFDISGRLVRTLLDANQTSGPHQVRWDGTLDSGVHAASGAYFYRITFQDGARSTRKMVLLK
jgi:hypothetical protein